MTTCATCHGLGRVAPPLRHDFCPLCGRTGCHHVQSVHYADCPRCHGTGRASDAHDGSAADGPNTRRAAVASALLTADAQVAASAVVLNEAQESMASALAALWEIVPDDGDDPVTAAADAALERWHHYLRVLNDYVGAIRAEVQIYAEGFVAGDGDSRRR